MSAIAARDPVATGPSRLTRGSGLPVVASTTFRSPSGSLRVTVRDISSAIMMQL